MSVEIIYGGGDYEEWKKQFKCQNCGHCCTNFRAKGVIEDIGLMKELLAWSRFPVPIKFPKQMVLEIHMNDAPCKHFNPITKLCMDYLNRPDLCRNYFCEKAKLK